MTAPMESSRPVSPGSALISLGVPVVFWSILPVMLKYFTRTLDPWTVNGARYMFALLFWLPHVIRHRGNTIAGRNIWKDAWRPATVHLLGQIIFAMTPYFNDATVINFVSRSGFVFATVFGFALLREERVLARSRLFWSGFTGTIAGLVLMYMAGAGTATTSLTGMLLLVGAAACWGLYSVLIRKFMHGYSVRQSYGVISLYAGPCVIALMFLFGDWRALAETTWTQGSLIALSGIMGLALGHVFFFRAIHCIGPIISESALLLLPFFTALLAFFTLGEKMNRGEWIGGIILVTSCAALLFSRLLSGTARKEDEDQCLPSPR